MAGSVAAVAAVAGPREIRKVHGWDAARSAFGWQSGEEVRSGSSTVTGLWRGRAR